MEDIYDVDSYSEKELMDILDLFHPTDRELEAKILSYIDKYDDPLNMDMIHLHTFFVNIYKRFFELENENEDLVEGFTTGPSNRNSDNNQNQDDRQNVQLITNLNYAKGKLNPILKQTYQRIITIDSQYRDSKKSISTNFTFNFTETLKDVLSLKLYAVQIPYTWYTISESYGSNFIYVKGNVPGIDNGYHDISINISPGNYTLSTVSNSGDTGYSITGAIQKAISDLPDIYTDVSFGKTSLSYNANLCKATFNMDIQKHFNESSYYFYFPGTIYSPYPATNLNRSTHLSSFLGFNSSKYSTCSVYSSRTLQSLDNTTSKYAFDASNNKIQVIQYYTDSTNNYIPGISTVYQSFTIEFPITDTNNIGYRLTQSAIYTIVNDIIRSDTRLNRPGMIDSSVNFIQIQGTDDVGNVFDNNGNYYFQWQIKLNRYNGYNIPQSKIVLIVPSQETSGTTPIWVGNTSCFYFEASYNEINNLISETYVYTSSFRITGNVYYSLICNDPQYNNGGINNYSYSLSPSVGYSLYGFLNEINTGFNVINSANLSRNGGKPIFNVTASSSIITSPQSDTVAYLNSSDSKFHLSVDMNKYFSTENFRIDISGSFLINLLGFSEVSLNINKPLTDNMIFTGIADREGNYSGNEFPLLMKIYPDKTNSLNNGITSDVSYHIFLPEDVVYDGISGLAVGINNIFSSFKDATNSYPLRNMSISITPTGINNTIKSILTVNVTKTLSQNDYTIHFYDSNVVDFTKSSWYKYLRLDASYNLDTYSFESYSDICGNLQLSSDNITLSKGGLNNMFYLIPIDEGVTGAGTLTFTISTGTYNRIQLFELINTQFDKYPETYGTRISFITDPVTSLEYTKIRWNINKIYTSQDYKIVFYDLYSFVSCYIGNSSVRNATWDTTLGWIMGFRYFTEYPLSSLYLRNGYYYDISNSTFTNNVYKVSNTYINNNNTLSRCIVSLSGDTSVSINLYNYFMVILDDFNPSHLNDGLITISPTDNNLSLPSYANRAKYVCDPVTNQVLNSGITNVASNNLTQNQIYSINQIINTQNTKKSNTNPGVFVSDIFGLVPIKTSGYTPGQVYVEYGGTLQAQDRIYFGPVNIHRMAVSLLNDRGEVVDLNGANWSLQFICEQLYQNNNDVKNG